MANKETIDLALRTALDATDVTVLDTSSGCGASFQVAIVSPQFEGKTLIARHRMVHEALKEYMPGIHALSIARTWTPAQQAAEQTEVQQAV